MLAAAVLASWLAQAEPAPPSRARPRARPGPRRPARAARRRRRPPPPPPDNAVGAYAGWGRRLGSEAADRRPGQRHLRRRQLSAPLPHARRPASSSAAALDFFYDKFADRRDRIDDGRARAGAESLSQRRVISQTSFALLQTVAWRRGRVRPFVAARPGGHRRLLLEPRARLPPRNVRRRAAARRAAPSASTSAITHGHRHLAARRLHAGLHPSRPTRPEPTSYSFLGDLFDVDARRRLPF